MDLKLLMANNELSGSIKFELTAIDLKTFAADLIKQAFEEGQRLAPTKEQDELLTREETAKVLKVSLPTLWHWNNKSILKPYRIGNKIRYKRSEINDCLTSINGRI